jgi:type I restriction enzyme S subunit
MDEWKTYKIGEIGTVVTGKTPSSNTPEQFGSVMPFVTPTDFKNYVKSIYGAERLISNLGIAANQTRIVPENSVLVTCIGSDMGKAAINKVACLTNQQINSIVINERLADKDFIYYAIIEKYDLLRTLAHGGSTMPIINKGQFEKIELLLPPVEKQKAIAKILSSLDDKIELNRRMNATLEAMARALFKAWFVDFEPVRANVENRPSTSASPKIAKLFPSDFENGIPKGWQVGTVSDLGDVVCGKTPSTKLADNFGDEIPFITIPDMHGKAVITRTARCLSQKGADSQHKKYLPAKSICVSCIATAGLVSMTSEPSQTNQQVNSVIPNSGFGAYFCYQVLNKLGEEIRTKGSGGSVFVNLNTGSFSRIPVLLPDEMISTSYENIAKPLFEKILTNEKERHWLSEIRDSLLPRLISGKLRVGQFETEIS